VSWPAWASASRPRPCWETLKKAGLGPAPRRAGPTWGQFLRSQAEANLATDLFTVDLLNGTTVYVLAVIEHATRRIRILGITPHPAGAWVTQQARNLLMDLDGQAATIKFVIRDRDTKFTAAASSVTPLGVGDAVAEYVADAVRVVRDSGLPNRTDAMFTTVEGDWDEVMDVVKRAVEAVAAKAPRVSLTLKADIRPGVTGALESKVDALERYLGT
jgi:uncharacterized protein (TIGR00106 family)